MIKQNPFSSVYKMLCIMLLTLPVFGALGQTYSFTNAGAAGIAGPSQTQVNAAYSSTTLSGAVTVVGSGVQRWVVPTTGTYSIVAAGASGGFTPNAVGGKGRAITTQVNLTAGTVLSILVGQEGGRAQFTTGYTGGGGGGSFVINQTAGTPIVIAGGGGGAGQGSSAWGSPILNGVDAPEYNVTSGANGIGYSQSWSVVGVGGTNGSGGTRPGQGGAGGGGYTGNGAGGAAYGGDPGISYTNGGTGGLNRTWCSEVLNVNVTGGFGGGAGAGTCSSYEANGGGGGGYSGGGGGNTRVGAGGGGGNFVTGTVVLSALNTGNGFVTITNLLTPAGALNFVKTTPLSGNYISVPHSSSLNLGSDFTIEAWINYTGTNNTIIDKGDYDYLMQINCDNAGFAPNKIDFYNRNTGAWVHSTGTLTPGVWTHVAITLTGGVMTFYINGVASGTANVAFTQDNGPVNIGRQNPINCLCNTFNGSMDELRIWNRALSDCEIKSTKDCELPNPTGQTGLAAYYKFNQGNVGADNTSITTVTDASANSNTGTLVGFNRTGATSNFVAGQITGTCAVYTAPSATITPSGATTFCQGGSVNLTAGGGTTYKWYTAATQAGLASAAVLSTATSVTANASGWYRLVATNAVGCTYTANDVQVTVNPMPTVNAVSNQEVCHNGTATAAISFSGAVAGTVYNWTNNTPSIGLAASGTGDIASFLGQNTGTTPVTATITVTPTANGCTGTPVTFTIRVNPIPTFNAIANQTVCSGAATSAVTFVGQVAGTTYSWSGGSSIGLANGSGATLPSFTAVNAGSSAVTANILVISNAAGASISCGTSRLFTITVNPTPTISGVTGTTTICSGANTILTASSTATSPVFNWYDAATGGNLLFSGSAFTTAALTNTTTYYVEVSSNSCVSSSRSAVTVTVNPLPTPTITAGGPVTFCAGGSVTLSAAQPAPSKSLSFNGINNAVRIPDINYAGVTSFTIEAWVKPNDITTNGYYEIARQQGSPNWIFSFQNNGTILSFGLNTTTGYTELDAPITASTFTDGNWHHVAATYDGANCRVYRDGVLIGTNSKTGNIVFQSNPTTYIGAYSGGEYFNGLIDEVRFWNVTRTQAQLQANMSTSLAANTSGLTAYYKFDEGTGTTVSDASGNGNNGTLVNGTSWSSLSPIAGLSTAGITSYLWSPGGAATSAITATSSGSYTVQVLDANGCTATSAPTTVTVNPLPTATITADGPTTFCTGGSVTLTASAGSSYSWSTGATSPFITVSTAGSYSVTVTNASNCSTTSAATVVTVNPLPTISGVSGSTAICSGTNTVLTAVSAANAPTFNWYTTSTGGAPVFTGDVFTTPVLSTNTTYYVEVSSNGCVSASRYAVTVIINAIPAVSGVSGANSICSGATTTLTASSTATTPTFNWYDAASGGNLLFTGSAFTTAALTNTTTYYTEVVSSGCVSVGRTATTVKVITINDQTVTASPAAVCGTGSSVITLASSQSGVKYTLRNNANNAVVGTPVDGTGSSISFNTGTISSTTTYNVLAQNTSGALNFDGLNNYVTINSNTAAMGLAGNSFTVSAWIYRNNNIGGDLEIFGNQNGCNLHLLVRNSRLYLGFCGNDIAGNTVINPNQWYHVAFTYNVSTQTQSIYVNGVLDATGAGHGALTNDGSVLRIGGYGPVNSSGGKFAGKIDELQIWNSAQSAAQISAGMNSCLTGTESGLIAYYNFDQGTGLSLTDMTGHGFNGVLTNMTGNEWTSGNVTCGASCSLQLSNTPTVTVNPLPTISAVTGTTAICSGTSTVLTAASAATAPIFNWYTTSSGGTPVFTGAAFTTPALSTTTTYYAEVVSGSGCVSAARTATTVNVTTINNQTVTVSPAAICGTGSATVTVGSSQSGVSYTLRNNANNSIIAGPVAGTGSAISFNTGTISSSTTYNVFAQTGGGGGALNFNGSNNYLTAPHTTSLNLSAGGQLTMEAWVNPGNANNWRNVMMKGSYGYGLAIDYANRIYFWDQGCGGCNDTWSDVTVPANQWSHIAVTVQDNGSTLSVTLYLNGVNVGNKTSPQASINDNTEPLYIGTQGTCFCNYYAGKMDDLRLWNTVRTQAQIQASMNSCLTGSETGLVANYKFDETSGATAADARAANNATLFNFTLPAAWTSGTVNCGATVASCSLQMSSTPTVTVNPIPTVSGVSGATTICTGGTAVLTASSSASAPTFNWYNASSGGTLLFTGSTFTSPSLSVATTYYVEVVSNGCTATSRFPVAITLTPLPTPTVSSNSPVCSGNTLTLSASGATNYSWTGPNGFTSTLQNPSIPNVTTAATGTYIVTASNNGCTGGTASTVVTVGQTPSIPVVSGPAIVCAGASATITATTSNGNIVWWNAPTGGSIVGTGSPFVVTPGSTTTYYAEGSAAGGAGVIVNTLAANALTAVEINAQTGDDRGGIVVTQASVFVNGDGGVGRFDHNLNIQAGLLPQRDGIFCDINPSTAGQLWTLWNTSSNNSPNFAGGVVNAIRQMDQNMNLGTTITLSTSINLGTGSAGIFSGSGYVLLYSSVTNSWYTIDNATGTVTNRGTAGGGGLNAYPTENWARWGWAEFNGTDYFAVYRDASNQSIVKKNISTGSVTTLAAYTNLSDMANIIYSPWDNRAYLHHEGTAQFRSGDESLEDVSGTSTTGGGATCASTARTGVTLTVVALPVASITAGGSTSLCPGTTVTLTANSGTGFTYQWYNNGQIINGATGISFIANNSGNYTVVITNSNGCSSAPSNAIVVNTDVQAPSIVCASNQSVNLNANCSVSLPDYRSLLGVSDNCTPAGSLIITQSPAAGTIVSGTGNMTVSFTVTDASGNSSNCSITVTKNDVTGPVVTGPTVINANTDPNVCGAVVNYGSANSIVFSQNFVQGATNSTWCNAWTSFRSQLVAGSNYSKLTIKGTFDQVGVSVTDPTVIAQIANALRTGGSGSWTTNGRTWAVGDCGGPGALSASGSTCSCDANGYVVRPCIDMQFGGNNPNWGGANTNTCNSPTQTLSVVFEISGGGNTGLTATDACSGNNVSIVQTAGLASGSTFPVGTTTNTFVATDASGNASTYSFNVVVTDNQLPVITVPSNITTTATGASGAVVNYTTPTATDNCSVSVALIAGLPTGSVFPLGTTTVTYRATDASGNAVTGSFTVTVSGRLPVINCPANIIAASTNGVCGANVNFAATETVGVPASTISYTENGNPVVSGSFFAVGTHTITAKATNIIGTSTCSFTITVNDTQAPNVITQPVTVYLDQNGSASITAAQINNGSSDNCGVASLSLNKSTFDCNDLTNTVQGAGNAMFFNGGYIDVPHESSISPLNQWTIETWVKTSVAGVQHSLIEKYNCTNEYGYLLRITSSNQLMAFALTGCGGGNVTGATTLAANTWYHVAATFNRSTGVLKVYVNGQLDGTATGISTPTTPSSLSLRIGARGNDANTRLQGWLDEVRVWDIERSQAQIQSTKNTKLAGTETGLQAYYSFEEAIGSATATDGATLTVANTGNLSGSVSRVSSTAPMSTPGTQVVLTVTDIHGNSASAPATVTVLDIINPVVTCPADISVNNDANKCGATVTIIPATATDNCSVVSIVGVRSDAHALTADYPIGNTTITWTATDASGNKATCTQTVTVTDNQPPVIVCPGDMNVIATSANGAVVNYTAPVGTDNCTGTVTVRAEGLASGSTFPIGTTVVTYTATDAAGLTASCSFNVIVTGLAPVINCPANIVVSSSANACGANVNYAAIETTAIPASTITYSIEPGSFFPVGTTTVTATARNAVGVSICSFTVTVVDDVVPIVITKNITIQLDATGNASITPAMIDNGSSDNCGIASMSVSKSNFTCADVAGSGSSSTSSTIKPYGWWKAENNFLDYTTNHNNGTPFLNPAFTAGNCGQAFQFNGVGSHVDVGNNDAFNGVAAMTIAAWINPNANGDEDQIASKSDHGVPSSWEFRRYGSYLQFTYRATDGGQYAVGADVLSYNTWQHVAATWDGITMKLYRNGQLVATATGAPMLPNEYSMKIGENQGYGDEWGAWSGSIDEVMFFTSALSESDVTQVAGSCDPFTNTNSGGNSGNTVILTVTDIHGNVSSAPAIVTVEDKIAPIVITQNITIQLDANGAASITPAQINNGSTDNCSIASYSLDKTVFDCSNVGANTVTLTVTDVNGNVSTATAVVTVEDKVAPTVITQNITVQLDANGAVTITPAQVNNGSTDNCSIATYSLDKTSFDCSNVGTNTVILTVTDVNGNVSTATAIVTVEDKVAPTVITKNITVQLDANGAVSITPADINNGSTDNCSIATYSIDKASFDCSNVGANTVTLTVTDVNGNVSTATAIVTVEDKVTPTVITQNIKVQLGANGTASITPAQVNNGSTDNCAIASYSLDKTTFDCSNVGVNTVILTVTDVNGNVSTATAVVTVEDKVTPTVITQNITVQLGANGTASITPAQVNNGSTDNCSIATYSLDKTVFDCSNVGLNTVTLTATDVNGNSSSATAVVTIEDHVPAVVITNNITIQLSATGAASITVADINNGSHDACGIASMVLSKTSFDCSNVGPNTVTLTVTDVNGNVSSNTAVVTVKDIIPAVVITKNITIQLNASGSATIAAADVNNGSNDACGIASMTVSPNVFSCANVGANTVTLTVTDVNGNVSSNTAVVTVQDKIAPVVITKPITVYLDGTGHISITAADVNNGSSDACGIASMSVSPSSFDCSKLGANTVTLTVTDVNGNVSFKTAVVTVQDKLGPVPTVNVLPTVTGQCSANIVIVNATCTDNCRCCRGGCHCHDNCHCHRNDNSWNNHSWNSWWWNNDDDDDDDCDNDADDYNTYYMTTPTALDNCSGLIKATTTDPLHYNTQGTYTINWKFVDANGNVTIQPQTVIVKDNEAPIPWVSTLPTISGQCSVNLSLNANWEWWDDDDDDNGYDISAPWAWDNCAGWIRATTTSALSYTTQGTYTIVWKFNDGHGNITIQNQTVVVKDNIAPKATVKNLPTVTGSCSATVTAVPTAKDNCVGIVNGTTTDPLTYTAQGTYTIHWSYTDGHGNTSTQTQTVVVDDDTKPVPMVTTLPTLTGECSVTVTSVPKANDNCKGVITGTTTDPLTYSSKGTYTIHWSYNDGNGNITNQNQTVVINDVTAPVPQVSTLPTLTGECSVTVTSVPKANDNCKGVITATTSDALTYNKQGTYTIRWSYNDGNGNITTQNQTVVISDVTKPTITAPAAAIVSCGTSTAPTVSATATDNCSTPTVTYSDVTSGNTITRTWKATDAAGNYSTAAQTLTIVDNTAPIITDPRDVTVSCGTSTDPSVTGRATATDNCSTPTVSYTDVTSGYTITRTWKATDASNNSATSVQVITIVDNTKPTITDIADVTVNCNGSTDPSATGTPTASDNCSAVTLSKTDVPSGNTIIRTWKATDASGNYATSVQVITIGVPFTTSISSVPTSNTYTGGVSTNLYLGYGAQSTSLQVGSLPSSGAPYTYVWSGTYTNKLSSTTTAAPVFTPTQFGYYTFSVTVTNKYGCTASCSISICVTDVRVPGTNGAKIYVTHTPNGKNAVAQTLQVALSSVSSHIGSSSCGSNGNDRLGSADQSPCNTTIVTNTGVSSSGIAKDGETVNTAASEEDLKVTAMPNPSTTFFTLKIESRFQTPVELRVMDGRGRVVDAKSKIGANSTIQIGHNYSSGTYYAELIQGTQRKVVQLIKGRG